MKEQNKASKKAKFEKITISRLNKSSLGKIKGGNTIIIGVSAGGGGIDPTATQ